MDGSSHSFGWASGRSGIGLSPKGREVAAFTSSCASGSWCRRVPSFTGKVNFPSGRIISLTLCTRHRSPSGFLAH
eukprot:2429949-Pyramimonas_sp.AAC.1